MNSAIEKQFLGEDWVSAVPEVYFKLREAIDDPDSSFKEIGRIISADAVLAAKLLKIVNSPFYGFPSQVNTISHALSIVGTAQLTDLILTTTVIAQFKDIPKDLININSFWKSSIACGVVARKLAETVDGFNPEQFYLMGMLRNIGTLALCKKIPGAVKTIYHQCKKEEADLSDLERKMIGYNHAEIGGLLLKVWKLPQNIIDPVVFHHAPFQAKQHIKETCLVHVADAWAYGLIPEKGEPCPPTLDSEAMSHLDLTDSIFEAMKASFEKELNDAVTVFL